LLINSPFLGSLQKSFPASGLQDYDGSPGTARKNMADVAYTAAKLAARLAKAKKAHDDLIAAAFRMKCRQCGVTVWNFRYLPHTPPGPPCSWRRSPIKRLLPWADEFPRKIERADKPEDG
jgi:hypothetical protein